jgi:hypothetical protein
MAEEIPQAVKAKEALEAVRTAVAAIDTRTLALLVDEVSLDTVPANSLRPALELGAALERLTEAQRDALAFAATIGTSKLDAVAALAKRSSSVA